MIILEGCDGTGKTTLARSLSDELHLSLGLRGTPNRDELYKVTTQDSYKALAHAVEGYHPPYIWDRLGPFSDPIYSRVMGRDYAFSGYELQYFKRMMQALRCPVIMCHVPLDVAELNQEKEHQMDGVSDNFPFIHGMYEMLADASNDLSGFFVYDYRVEGAYIQVKDKIQHYMNLRQEREWH